MNSSDSPAVEGDSGFGGILFELIKGTCDKGQDDGQCFDGSWCVKWLKWACVSQCTYVWDEEVSGAFTIWTLQQEIVCSSVHLLWRCRHRSDMSSSLSFGSNKPTAANIAENKRQTPGGALHPQCLLKGEGSGVWCHLGAGCGFPTSLKTNKHDDVVLPFSRGPGLHTGVDQLTTHTHYTHITH